MNIKRYIFSVGLSGILLCPCFALAAKWNDPGVELKQNSAGRYYDGKTGQYVDTTGMTKKATVDTGKKATVDTGKKTGTGASKAAKGAGKALGVAAGGAMIYGATASQEKHTVGDFVTGVAGGAIGGASWGWIGAAVGAVVGGTIVGSQLFSETDCLTDPQTKLFTCCNTAFNKGQRQAKIGDYMFCSNEDEIEDSEDPTLFIGGVRQCLQGGSATKDTWWNGLSKDDAWAAECKTRWCDGETPPASGIGGFIKGITDSENICWRWDCIDGYTRYQNTCKNNSTGTIVDHTTIPGTYDAVIDAIETLRQKIISQCGNM